MPLIIAGILYVVIAASALAVVGIVCLARRQPPGRPTLGGAAGSVGGFLLGCVAGVLACFLFPTIGMHVGATAIVVTASLGAALLGMAVGAAAARLTA